MKGIKGNAPTTAEAVVIYGIGVMADYWLANGEATQDFLAGVEATSVAVLGTELLYQMQVAKQIWVPAQEVMTPG
ncbi:MAG: hypothetical protein QW750_06190 [Zestosphaera sp.]